LITELDVSLDITRHEEAMTEVVNTAYIDNSSDVEMDQMKEIVDNCHQLMRSRNAKYGDSWKVLSIPSMANLSEMKLHRIANMANIDPKVEDELIDVINYCTFALWKLKNK